MNKMISSISFYLANPQKNDRKPKGIKVKHGIKIMEFSDEFYNQFHGNQTS
jgi:hypothetical protein